MNESRSGKQLNIATVFSGIGAPEQAFKRLGVNTNIVFACDNGEVEIKNFKTKWSG